MGVEFVDEQLPVFGCKDISTRSIDYKIFGFLPVLCERMYHHMFTKKYIFCSATISTPSPPRCYQIYLTRSYHMVHHIILVKF